MTRRAEKLEGPPAVMVPTDSLVPWAKNPRKNAQTIAKVVASIKRWGFGAPILARKENREIMGGHTRWEAAKAMGLAKVPVRFMDLSARDAHLLALADNKLGEEADWDDEKLAEVLEELKAEATGDDELIDTGFTLTDIDEILEGEADLMDPGKNGLSAAGTALIENVKFGKWELPLTEADAEKLEKLIEEFRKANGSLDGFLGRYLR